MTSDPRPAVHELTLTRNLDAPRELVFKAWTDPKHLAQWFGPHGFTNPVCEVDLRPGGALLIHMAGFGEVYPMEGTFDEIVDPERLAFRTRLRNEAGDVFLEVNNLVTFEALGSGTLLTLTARVVTAGPGSEGPLEGMNDGWTQTLDKLGAYVERM